MKDEIKSMLHSIESYINQYKEESGSLSLTFDNWKLLLDYITNLQNLLKLRTDCLKMNQERIDKAREMINFIKENEKLMDNDIKDKLIENLTLYLTL